mmetsp:Transcript_78242/g.234482  ORF Transcript_78242/g.234482 Transcript_78242/m.234482 type:complete len:95 (+) Transcript_78242:736-1020(+)
MRSSVVGNIANLKESTLNSQHDSTATVHSDGVWMTRRAHMDGHAEMAGVGSPQIPTSAASQKVSKQRMLWRKRPQFLHSSQAGRLLTTKEAPSW